MCGPLATFAIGALQAVVGFAAASQEAKAVEENAQQSYVHDQHMLSTRQAQEQTATAQKLNLKNIEEAQKRAEVEVSAAEGGVSGLSVDNLLAGVSRQAANARTVERSNLNATVAQLQMEKTGSRNRNQGRINSSPKPSPLSLVAGIGSAGLDAYAQMS